jgi:hypothetical protein
MPAQSIFWLAAIGNHGSWRIVIETIRHRRGTYCGEATGATFAHIAKAERRATMRTELLRFNGAVERDPAIDAWMK